MKVYCAVLSAWAMTWACNGFACTLVDSREGNTYHLNLPTDQCRNISYIDGRIIPLIVSYPEGQVVHSAWASTTVTIRLYYIDESYNFGALLNSKNFVKSDQGIDTYRIFNQYHHVLTGSDNEKVDIQNMGNTWLARRMQRGILILYQYTVKIENLREIDEFVRKFVERILEKRIEK